MTFIDRWRCRRSNRRRSNFCFFCVHREFQCSFLTLEKAVKKTISPQGPRIVAVPELSIIPHDPHQQMEL